MRATLSGDTLVRRTATIVFAELDDELLAVDAPRGFLYSLNASGAQIWSALSEPATVHDLCARLLAVYDVDDATCRRTVIALLDRMCDEGLVEIVGTAA
jgi:hypothetical protein